MPVARARSNGRSARMPGRCQDRHRHRARRRTRHAFPKAAVNSSNANSAEAEACTEVLIVRPQIAKDGMAKQYIGRMPTTLSSSKTPATYRPRQFSVVDSAPAVATVVSAEGGSVSGNSAMWTIDTLKSGSVRHQEGDAHHDDGRYARELRAGVRHGPRPAIAPKPSGSALPRS